jgi:trans-aconitate 2-methyltransferase
MPWNPERYHKFQRERAAPFEDLLQLVSIRAGLRAIDLGCGTGELTRRLADALPGSEVIGLDSSPEMLARAAEYARPGLRFEQGSIETVGGTWDLVFSHAALQWVADHAALIPALYALVSPGGQLVAQMPSNHDHLTHRLIGELAGQEPYRSALGGWTRQSPVLPIDRYAEMLFEQGGENITIFEKVYPHVLENADALADWTSGTALVPYAERLGEALYEQFMIAYRERLRARWPAGPVFYGFRRTLFAVSRPEAGKPA